MSVSFVTLALAKNYVKKSLIGIGALKGAPCTVKSVDNVNDQVIITLGWEDNEGGKHETKVYLQNGTPIYEWQPNFPYQYGDLAIYQAAFYRCTFPNSDASFDPTHWEEIGSADGNYDIVQSKSNLPARFSEADRKMYYVIDEDVFYLWDGEKWDKRSTTPKASSDTLGGVIIDQNGLDIDENGILSIESIDEEDINDLFEE